MRAARIHKLEARRRRTGLWPRGVPRRGQQDSQGDKGQQGALGAEGEPASFQLSCSSLDSLAQCAREVPAMQVLEKRKGELESWTRSEAIGGYVPEEKKCDDDQQDYRVAAHGISTCRFPVRVRYVGVVVTGW